MTSGPQYEPPPPFAPPQARVQPLPAPPPISPPAPPPGPGLVAPPRPSWQVITLAATTIAAIALVAIVGLFRASSLSDDGAHQPRTLSLPATAGELTLIRTVDAATVRSLLGRQIGSLGLVEDALDTAKIGVYGQSATAPPTVIFVGFDAASSPTIADLLHGRSPAAVVDQVLGGTSGAAPATSMSPGQLGGSLKCANADRDGTPFTPCAWADADTVAVVMRVGTVDLADVAATTRDLRAAAEH